MLELKYKYSGSLKVVTTKNDTHNHFLIGNFILKKDFIKHINRIMERIDEIGVIYGEFGKNDFVDVSLSEVSHVIRNMKITSIESDLINLQVKCQMLDTHWGKELKYKIDNIGCDDLRFFLRYFLKNNEIKKILTVDIDFLSNHKKFERREKLLEISKKQLLNS